MVLKWTVKHSWGSTVFLLQSGNHNENVFSEWTVPKLKNVSLLSCLNSFAVNLPSKLLDYCSYCKPLGNRHHVIPNAKITIYICLLYKL